MIRRKRKAPRSSATQKPVILHVRTPDSLPVRMLGLGLAGTGAAHFTAPRAFDGITATAFPEKTRQWTYRNGMTELLLGLAIAFRRTRPVGAIGSVAYAAFLANRVSSQR
ncbi:hypothetical protein [Antrihabitans sp. YC2-6]|uniref:hypothetical protein n=1 Tax=Antrihabitans sp. YC2-6 TaxID=2799498 RepID=UPI001F46D323